MSFLSKNQFLPNEFENIGNNDLISGKILFYQPELISKGTQKFT